jgi:hypothetical protein
LGFTQKGRRLSRADAGGKGSGVCVYLLLVVGMGEVAFLLNCLFKGR